METCDRCKTENGRISHEWTLQLVSQIAAPATIRMIAGAPGIYLCDQCQSELQAVLDAWWWTETEYRVHSADMG
jgi:hypothetical protein